MRIYPLLRPLMFALPTEHAHALALASCNALIPSVSFAIAHRIHSRPSRCWVCDSNRVGLAAGFDKNARYIDALGALGFASSKWAR